MKRTPATSPPVAVRKRTIEDDDSHANRARADIRVTAGTAVTADAMPDSLLLARKGCAQAGNAAKQRQRQRKAGGGVSEESRRIMLSD